MSKNLFFSLLVFSLSISLSAAAQNKAAIAKRFPEYSLVIKGTKFVFSSADATIKSPVVITIPGRALRENDRVNRVNLQEYWLSKNVPPQISIVDRAMVECDRTIKNEHPFCDLYMGRDSKTGKDVEYYIYIGNWP